MDFQEIFVILDSGLCFYSKSREKRIDSNLFGGFFTALNTVAQTIGGDEISSLVLNQTLYTFSKKYNLLFILRTDTGAKQDQIRSLLVQIKGIFFKIFPPEQYWVEKLATRMSGTPTETKGRIGNIAYDPKKHQMLDTEYEELLMGTFERMKLNLW